MLVGELDLPVLGREEDAADAIATIVMLAQEDEDRELAIAYLEDAIEGWFRRDLAETERLGYERLINDPHSLSGQRAYQIACFMYGSNAAEFEYIGERYALNQNRREMCVLDYEQAERSWLRVLAPHIREDGEPSRGKITIEYGATENYAYFADLVKEERLLEELAESLEEVFILPRNIKMHAMECDQVNAYYYPDTGDMVLCYELVERERQSYLAAVLGIGQSGADD